MHWKNATYSMQKIIQELKCVYFILFWIRELNILSSIIKLHQEIPLATSISGLNTFLSGAFEEFKRVTESHIIIILGKSIAFPHTDQYITRCEQNKCLHLSYSCMNIHSHAIKIKLFLCCTGTLMHLYHFHN